MNSDYRSTKHQYSEMVETCRSSTYAQLSGMDSILCEIVGLIGHEILKLKTKMKKKKKKKEKNSETDRKSTIGL